MKKLLSTFFAILFLTVAVSTVWASGESNCQIVYGGGEVCREQVKYTINKLVEKKNTTKGGTSEYVENLTINDARHGLNQNVNFKIVVENTGDTDIRDLRVVDTFPELLSFVAGVGATNEGGKKVEFIIGELKKGEKKEYVITAKTANDIPNSITCVTNNVKAFAADGSTAEDNAQLCIEKPGDKPVVTTTETKGGKPVVTIAEKPTVEKIPATGPEAAILFGLIPAGALGAFLRNKFN